MLAVLLSLPCSGCVIGRTLYFNLPTLDAPSYFAARTVRASSHPAPFARRAPEAAFTMRQSRSASFRSFEELLAANETRAFVVLHHDTIVYERYFGGVTAETRLPSFSMTKTFSAVLVGCAERDGLIDSPRQRLVELVPELADKPGYGEITLEHLLRMTSGIDFVEEPLDGPVLYYTTDLRGRTDAYDVLYRPGDHYEYGSINIQLLWEVLHRRLGDTTVARYFEERVWDALGAEHAATWSLDSAESGVEKFSAGLNAVARDYARLGVLFQHRGRLGGRQVISERWVDESLTDDDVAGVVHTKDGAVRRGRYQWFLTPDGRAYFAKGYHGQYVFVQADRDVIVVRFGEGYGDVDWTAMFTEMAESL